jgi:hypothetical protein
MADFDWDKGVTGQPKMNDTQMEKWMEYRERTQNRVIGLVGLLSFISIIAGTVIVLAWSPWN